MLGFNELSAGLKLSFFGGLLKPSLLSSVFIAFFLWIISSPLFAQDGAATEGQGFPGSQIGVFVGHLLPDQIPGVTEITTMSGLRFSSSLGRGLWEINAQTGRASGVTYNLIDALFRYDTVVEGLVAMVSGGAAFHRSKGAEETNMKFGAAVGLGLLIPFSANFGFRTDMKFYFNPGVALLITYGFSLRI